ncbi:3-hydroxyacyl-CoA dehydrogenase NAD-binding domain-containing protein [Estrella lausannensis]|uniref:enoyl-CoA hydratase n=1 Tax=Estrella lausannensis TaxID=483423 RepID=A0A0H5DPU6_9BACT|nr:3-hydroxyacyl-CoA dehydrogenase NAD-binding domain-containing protein [Estrella lausannensis]CRX38502.1 Fatty acid oxidation complex subunit alpha [Estrella lausannensis]
MGKYFEKSVKADVATLWFDYPGEKVNKISPEVLEELDTLIGECSGEKLKALVIRSKKEDIFIAGADLKTFEAAFGKMEIAENLIERGHAVFNKLEALPFPTVAVIDGVTLGGGTELALACTFRIATDNPKVQIGLPEVNLGIFPGWGGTQRLPRIIGLEQGVMMIITGRSVDAKKAFKLKLVDSLVPKEFLDEYLNRFVEKVSAKKGRDDILSKRGATTFRSFLLEKNPFGRVFFFDQAKKGIMEKTKGFYPAPLIALDLMKKTATVPLKRGLEEEVRTFKASLRDNQQIAKNLIDIFFAQEEIKKNAGAYEKVEAMPIKRAGLIGAGTMGAGIAYVITKKDIPVRFREINLEAMGKGYAHVSQLIHKEVKKKKLTKELGVRQFHHVSGGLDLSGFNQVDIVIEAALENIDIKKKIYAELESVLRPDAIIATNTSTLMIDKLAEGMRHPERLIGMHFFNPPEKMPLVEIIKGEKTAPVVVSPAVEFCKKLGKTPLVVKDCPGFLVNRIFAAAANEAGWLLQEGVPMKEIEEAILSFGMPMGPFTLADEVGNDIAYKAFHVIENAYGERMKQPQMAQLMDENKLLGKKTGEGYYIWTNGSGKKENPKVQELLVKAGGKKRESSKKEIEERFVLAMVNEASRCLEEGIVPSSRHLDMALLYGIGFPPFRGGLLKYADTIGSKEIVDKLRRFEIDLGRRFQPSPLLSEMAKSGKGFYSP